MGLTSIGGREHWKVSVVVPALDEEATLAKVLAAAAPFADELLVVDGHSSDGTRRIAEEMGVPVVLDDGRGKGSAIRRGLELAVHPVVVFVDADGSHEVSDIPRLVAPILAGEAELVVGSRMSGGSDELSSDLAEVIRLTGSLVINLAINWRWKVRLSDTQNGFRAVVRDVGRSLGLTEEGTTIEQEMVMKALASGERVVNVPSHEYRRQGGVTKVLVRRVWPRYVWNVLRHVLSPSGGRGRAAAAPAPVLVAGEGLGPASTDTAPDGGPARPARTA